ncbi:hypothetical protein X560_1985 [Listeria fleischmannii 1991]|uniref:Uncharacterized protein n=2 Tax=Listeria fleischmannii TaxID=1069827 RepID=A0A2X3H949_9LIST|nr:hypothetical protein [Listeria fleischmannii]EMG27367.1 hypothetical protein LFLEISCH_11430 [Listeria fleischmannii subsp. fleischmannii LU2006-1]KMT58769.1 hypothetical protein X560_1985 [Listeria fleischmannii 1991]SQC71066.1 Uncharacterised protein [Listeria fleischmannii subsp. fleischmannii]
MTREELLTLHDILTKDIDSIENPDNLEIVTERIHEALSLDLRRFKEKQLSNVSVRMKKATKVKFSLGDVFQIYLKENNVYSYAMCVKEEREEEILPYHLFAFFNYFTPEEATMKELFKYLIRENVGMLSDCGITGILNGEWQKVSTLSPIGYDFSKLEYVSAEDGGVLRPNEMTYYKSIGDPNNGEFIKIDPEEARKINNPYGSPGQHWIEMFLENMYKGIHMLDIKSDEDTEEEI